MKRIYVNSNVWITYLELSENLGLKRECNCQEILELINELINLWRSKKIIILRTKKLLNELKGVLGPFYRLRRVQELFTIIQKFKHVSTPVEYYETKLRSCDIPFEDYEHAIVLLACYCDIFITCDDSLYKSLRNCHNIDEEKRFNTFNPCLTADFKKLIRVIEK